MSEARPNNQKENSDKTRTLKLAIVGAGLVGKRHAAAIGLARNIEISCIVDPGEDGRAFARTHGLPYYQDIGNMFADGKPDGVILSTPTLSHVSLGLECIEQGCPVLVEKPLAVTADAGRELVIAAEKNGIPLLVGHHRRHNPLIQKAHELISEGAIGEVRAVNVTCWFYKPDAYFDVAPWRKKFGAGPVSVNLVHDVDLMRHLCGEIVSVQAVTAPSRRGFENEDVAAAVLRFENGVLGTVTVSDSIAAPWSWEMTSREYPVYAHCPESSYLIGGNLGSLSLPNLKLWRHDGEPDWWQPISATSVPQEANNPLLNQVCNFADVIRAEAEPVVSGLEGLRTLQVVEAIQTAAREGGTVLLAPEAGVSSGSI